MSDPAEEQHALINEVLGEYTPLGEDHPVAQETLEAVREELLQRRQELEELEPLTELSTIIDTQVIRPGDTLLLTAPNNLNQQQVVELRDRVMERMPKLADVVILGGGLRVAGIYREDDDA